MPDRPFTILSTGAIAAPLPDRPGVTVEQIHFIRTEPADDPAVRRRAVTLAALPLTAIFTSQAALEAVGQWMAAGAGSAAGWSIYCTSGATRRLAAKIFGATAIQDSAPDAEHLAARIPRNVTAPIVFFCGNRRRETLPATLRQAGLDVEELVVYHTFATPARLDIPFDAYLFFSPSAVESFYSLNRPGANVPLFALGESTATALRAQGPNPVIVGRQPDKIALLQTAFAYADAHPILL